MNVGIFPNEETALQSMSLGAFDVFLITGFEGCCHTMILVPSGPYSDIFEDIYDGYLPRRTPLFHSYYERNKTLSEVKEEISIEVPEALFFDERAAA
jgi:hypothetical protein